jgi:alpha-ribazole phosphatase
VTRLWLVRHATPLVAAGTCYGALDVAAAAQATQQAAQALARALPQGAVLRSSTLQRCTQLATALCALRTDLSFTTDSRLREMDFGSWEGRRWDALDAAALQAWSDDFAHHRPGGGESVHGFMARVTQAWDEAPTTGTDLVWITHAGVIRAATLLHTDQVPVTQAAQWPAAACGFGQWRVLDRP